MLAGNKKVSGHRFARTRLVVLARNLVFTPVGQLEPGMLETNFQHGHSR